VRRDAQGTRDGELSVPRRRRPVCAIDHILKNRKHLTRSNSRTPRRSRKSRSVTDGDATVYRT
jgi:hypothetical protein